MVIQLQQIKKIISGPGMGLVSCKSCTLAYIKIFAGEYSFIYFALV